MNSWYAEIIEILVILILVIFFIIFLVMLIKAKRNNKNTKSKIIFLSVDIILLACSLLFVLSHPTYYKFNDWFILKSDIKSVVLEYGQYDLGSIGDGKSGKIGYYIYTDNSPIMPDHLKHYYWIYYDENGMVEKVEESLQPGG